MNTEIRDLIKFGKKIDLAQLEIEGEPKRVGHGELTFEDQTITLTIIGHKGTSVDLGQDLKIKAEMEDGKILIMTGRPHEIAHRLYPRITVNVSKVMGRRSGKDPDEKTNDPPETFIININVKDLAATNGTAVITEERLDISSRVIRTKKDHLVIVPNRIHVLEDDGLQITYEADQGERQDGWIPITTAVAYIHGTASWPYYVEIQAKGDAIFTLRNSFHLPRTRLRPITNRLAKSNPVTVVNVVKSVSDLIATHRFKSEVHDILHNFIVGTGHDAVAGTLLAAAALEGLCRLLEGKIDSLKPSAKKIIEAATARLHLGPDVVLLGLSSWDRVRNTLSHGHFHRAHLSVVHPQRPARPADENILHDFSRISGLFHAIILKEAKYTGPFALSILEDKEGLI